MHYMMSCNRSSKSPATVFFPQNPTSHTASGFSETAFSSRILWRLLSFIFLFISLNVRFFMISLFFFPQPLCNSLIPSLLIAALNSAISSAVSAFPVSVIILFVFLSQLSVLITCTSSAIRILAHISSRYGLYARYYKPLFFPLYDEE